MKSIKRIHKESGAVSLFSVVFAMLLMSVVTISFVRLMTSDQNRATNNDLAQSAYDSSLAGVEDAKRALVWYQQQCKRDPGSCGPSGTWSGILSSNVCNRALVETGVVTADAKPNGTYGEVAVQSSTTDGQSLNQAYTCVTVKLDTPYFVGSLTPNESALIPLVATGSYNTVKIEWFSKDDVSSPTGEVKVPSTTGGKPLLINDDWVLDRPSLLRTQFMQVGNNFALSDFDFTQDGGESNANTLFLYPSRTGDTATQLAIRDVRRDSAGKSVADDPADAPLATRCALSVTAGNYACSIMLTLPTAVGGGRDAAYLRLTALYAATHYRISLFDGGSPVEFRGVQPIVDSTGRANDVFRRVQSNVDLYDTSFPYPEGAVDVNGSFCKNFGVSENSYSNNDATCTP